MSHANTMRHLTIEEAQCISDAIERIANSKHFVFDKMLLSELKNQLVNQQLFEMLDDIKRLEITHNIYIPFVYDNEVINELAV